jgi:hypothetical protein
VDTLTDILLGVNLFMGAMVTGAMVLEFMAILPTFRDLGPSGGLRLHRTLSPRPWRYLPVCGAVAFFSAVAAVAIDDHFTDTESALEIAALVLVVCFIAASAGLYRNEDLRARALPDDPGEAAWAEALARLHRLHIGRMLLWLCAYALFVVVAVSA